ncbi:MAG: hypothetical protein K9M03_01720 [Kiritimatiellales bacterium]|nr:hypothetical protein [Kiritimatiellales bacterium]
MRNNHTTIDRQFEIEEIIFGRLKRYKKGHNLITYEGTAEDKLCLDYVKNAWHDSEYEVICSIRPCMDIKLQEEVRSFAQQNGYRFVDYIGDCVVDEKEKQFISICCSNVRSAIQEVLSGTNGLLIQGSIMDNKSRDEFKYANDQLQSFSTSANSSSPLVKPGPKSVADWDTLFLFDGLSRTDFLTTYFSRMPTEIEDYQIPVCYLLCYNERQQLAIREMLRGSFEDANKNCTSKEIAKQ